MSHWFDKRMAGLSFPDSCDARSTKFARRSENACAIGAEDRRSDISIVSHRRTKLFCVQCVPKARRIIFAGGHDLTSVGAEAGRDDAVFVTALQRDLMSHRS